MRIKLKHQPPLDATFKPIWAVTRDGNHGYSTPVTVILVDGIWYWDTTETEYN